MGLEAAPRDMIVRQYLYAGYGVEDISIMTKISEEMIRFYVRRMRENGDLERIYRPAKRSV